MALKVSIAQAACNALAALIASKVTNDIVVEPRWPDPGKVSPQRAITVVMAGHRELEYLDAYVVSSAQVGNDPILRDYIYAVAAITQPIQLDIWDHSDVGRDDIIAQLDQIFGDAEAQLDLGDGWTGSANPYFDEGPSLTQDGDEFNASEYRATYNGAIDMILTVTAREPKLAQIFIKQRLSEEPLSGPEPTDILTKIDATT